jgi:hypothetical protein
MINSRLNAQRQSLILVGLADEPAAVLRRNDSLGLGKGRIWEKEQIV